MMNKICQKMKDVALLSVIMTIVLALSIVLTTIFGVNYAATVKDQNTLTVTVNRYFYDNNLDDVFNVKGCRGSAFTVPDKSTLLY